MYGFRENRSHPATSVYEGRVTLLREPVTADLSSAAPHCLFSVAAAHGPRHGWEVGHLVRGHRGHRSLV